MLGDLQKVQNNLYTNESIEQFLKSHSIFDAVKMLNKTNKIETKARIKQFFYKITQSNRYKDFLLAGLDQTKQNKEQFLKYIASENSQEYFELLKKKVSDVIALLDTSPSLIPLIFSLVHSNSYGIKMVKVFSDLYSNYSHHNCLYSEQIRHQLQKGLKSQDTVVQMRFVQIIANIATQGGRSYQFVKDALQNSLNIYDTQDILLKLNIVQIISALGDGAQTSKLLRGHKVWAKVQKDALDNNQQLYVRKSLLILLINMATHQQYEMTPKFMKNIVQFLTECFKQQGQYLQSGLQLSSHLMRSNQGAKLIVQNTQLFGQFLKLSRSPQERIKNLFVYNLTMLTNKTNGKKTKPMVMNILNCVGNPNLSIEISHNVNSNNFTTQGIQGFCQWFVGLLQLPFEDLELKLISLFTNLLQYNQICQTLFEDKGTTKYLLRPVGKGNTVKVLRAHKNQLVIALIEKGKKDWKNTKLQTYGNMIQKQLKNQKMDVQYAIQAD